MKKLGLTLIAVVFLMVLCSACTSEPPRQDTITDLAGNEIILPDKVEKIITLAPSNTEIIVSLGLSDNLVAIDSYSVGLEGIREDLPQFNIMQPDTEQIIALEPDMVITTGMSNADGGEDVFKPLRDAGVCVVAIPTASSIDEIEESIEFIGKIVGKSDEAAAITTQMEQDIEAIKAISATITDKKKVYFEIAAAPNIVSFGNSVFLNEILEIIGAENIFVEQEGWINVSEENIISAEPDVILTNVNYIENPVEEILGRNGWEVINAIKNNDVYFISTNPSSLPNQHIIIALQEMAKAIYPDIYKDL